MDYEKITEYAMNLILLSGESKKYSAEAIRFAKKYEFEKAKESLKNASKAFNGAHEIQNILIKEESSTGNSVLNVLMIHAQDHLSSSLIMKENAMEMIEIYKKFKEIEDKL